jgi:hypothetical protein
MLEINQQKLNRIAIEKSLEIKLLTRASFASSVNLYEELSDYDIREIIIKATVIAMKEKKYEGIERRINKQSIQEKYSA